MWGIDDRYRLKQIIQLGNCWVLLGNLDIMRRSDHLQVSFNYDANQRAGSARADLRQLSRNHELAVLQLRLEFPFNVDQDRINAVIDRFQDRELVEEAS